MSQSLLFALVIIVAILVIVVVAMYKTGGGNSMSFVDGTTVSLACVPGATVDVLKATYGAQSGVSAPVDVTATVQAALAAGAPLVVSTSTMGVAAGTSPGELTISYRCVGAVPKSSFSSPPFISCDRSSDLEYGVDATVKGGLATIWAPYVMGSEFDRASDDGHNKKEGFRSKPGAGAPIMPVKPRRPVSSVRIGTETFEPVPRLDGQQCSHADDLEYRIDDSLRGAPVPQALPYSKIVNLPPTRGVQNPTETEPDNMITNLASNARIQRWSDPYLTDAAAFGRGPLNLPKNDPGYMEVDRDFLESFVGKPALLTAVTGRSTSLPKNMASSRSRDISRHVEPYHTKRDDGFNGQDSEFTSVRFNRIPIQTKRARGRR